METDRTNKTHGRNKRRPKTQEKKIENLKSETEGGKKKIQLDPLVGPFTRLRNYLKQLNSRAENFLSCSSTRSREVPQRVANLPSLCTIRVSSSRQMMPILASATIQPNQRRMGEQSNGTAEVIIKREKRELTSRPCVKLSKVFTGPS